MTVLTAKQRAYLRGLAVNEPAIMQIGKDGIGDNLTRTVSDALEARELIKLTVLPAAGITPREAADRLAALTGSAAVCVTGRKIVLYRESEKHKKIEL
ncbi:MAG: YhbY family RNA-binding protein [Clostridiales bacterium]|nr:YhbY family RNA-binding protein [Clostridiales bacterium]